VSPWYRCSQNVDSLFFFKENERQNEKENEKRLFSLNIFMKNEQLGAYLPQVGNVLQILLRLPNYITTTTTAANAVECR
jgi:hypothetical protein